MSKVIGAKVSEELYDQIASIGSISDVIKQAVIEYLERRGCNGNNEVNHTQDFCSFQPISIVNCVFNCFDN